MLSEHPGDRRSRQVLVLLIAGMRLNHVAGTHTDNSESHGSPKCWIDMKSR